MTWHMSEEPAMRTSALALINSLVSAVRTGAVTTPPRAAGLSGTAAAAATAQRRAPAPAAAERGPSLFVDIGANLLDSVFDGEYRGKRAHPPDIDAVLARAASAGVERAIVTAGSLDESRRALEFVRARRDVGSPVKLYCTVGVHPTRSLEFVPPAERVALEAAMRTLADAGEAGGDAARAELAAAEARLSGDGDAAKAVAAHVGTHVAALRALLDEGRAEGLTVAVGECGLDYDRLHFCPAGVQKIGFEAQLALADATGLPLFLHNRATAGDFAAICSARKAQMHGGGVVHSFDGDASELDELLGLGLDIGLNGCSLKTADNLAVAARVPLKALHLETDAPWCAIKRTHAGHSHVRPLIDAATAEPYEEVKKEKWTAGACVKDRCEPCHIVHVLQVVNGARSAHGEADTEEERVAAAAYANSMRLFWPNESSEQ